jgi:DNA-binding response OmpR family regulator
LPRCDGASIVREVRRDPSYAGLKIFAITGHTREDYSIGEGPGGVDRWYSKPVDPSDLVRGMRQEVQSSSSRT